MAGAVTLGGITFRDFEVPDSIPFGGDQKLVVHRLIGDKRVIDAMGRDDMALEWSGTFLGEDALGRARALDALRIAGAPLALAWSELSYSVIIRRFVGNFARSNLIPYSITCEVIADTASPSGGEVSPTTDDMVADDMAASAGLVAQVDDEPLTGLFSTLQTAVAAAPSIASATREALDSIAEPLVEVQGRVSQLIGAADDILGGLEGFAGVQLGVPGEASADNLRSATAAMTSLDPLYGLSSLLGRVATNVAAVGASGAKIAVAGGDLYALASEAYGDPAGWTTIARANDLVDPMIDGVQSLRIPPIKQASDGVLSLR